MKKIAVYRNGMAGVYDPNGIHSIKIGGEEPEMFIDATEENMKKYFPDRKEVKNTIKVK